MSQPALITADELLGLLQQGSQPLVIADCRYSLTDPEAGALAYAQGHIPGAVHADLGTLMSSTPTGSNGRHPLPDAQAFAQGMAALGAHNNTLIIAYDAEDSTFAARLWWLLRWVGHDQIRVLDGGLKAWAQAGGKLSTQLPQPQAGTFSIQPGAMPTASFSDVLANISQPKKQVLDARSADRYRGENETMDPVGGHIPGAINRFYKLNLGEDGRFKPAQQLRAEFSALLGDTPATAVIHQCGSGVSACHNLLAMDVAGMNGGTLYPGSWSEWCSQSSAPVERG